MDKIYPVPPEDLKGVSDEDLTKLTSDLTEIVTKATDRDPELLKGLTQAQALDQTREAVQALQAVKDEQTARDELEKTFDAELAKLREDAGIVAEAESGDGDDDGDDDTGDGDAGDGEEAAPAVEAEATDTEPVEAEPVEAEVEDRTPVLASSVRTAGRAKPPAATGRHKPVEQEAAPAVAALRAAANLPSVPQHSNMDLRAVAEAMCEMNDHSNGGGRVTIASADRRPFWPEDRKLGFRQEGLVEIQRILDEQVHAIVASGGLCAPVTPYYQLANISQAGRPVRDSLPGFNAARGGLQFAAPATLASVASAVGIKTAAQDALGGTNAAKTCLAVTCPSFSTVNLEMIYRCLQFGNLNARSFPELIQQWTELSMAYHSRVAESALLDYIDAHSTATTVGPIYGTMSTIVTGILYAAAGMRSRHRMAPEARFRTLLPLWLREALLDDNFNSQFYRFDLSLAQVEGMLREKGVEPVWYEDGATGAGQIFGTQSAGALLTFPNTIVGYVFPEGSFLFLDGGTLDLGIVRDSTLNATNDFQIFMETFEAAAYVGVESLKITFTACENGTTGPTATAITCS